METLRNEGPYPTTKREWKKSGKKKKNGRRKAWCAISRLGEISSFHSKGGRVKLPE